MGRRRDYGATRTPEEVIVVTDLNRIWRTRRMRDYTQHLPMNCGGIAAVFALYGPGEVVPRSMDSDLTSQSVPAMGIARIINNARKPGISAEAHLQGGTIRIADYSGSRGFREERIGFLGRLTPDSVTEGIRDILVTNEARCVIISGQDSNGFYHWQTYYIPVGGDSVRSYNARTGWYPALSGTSAGTPTGLILVGGPRIQP
jgi:hypothetical protein